MMKVDTTGTVTSPKGFQACGVAAGLKISGANDMALIYSETPCTSAGAFTSNLMCAAPVIYDRQILSEGGTIRAVIVNSGNANSCTGAKGLQDAEQMAFSVADKLGIGRREILVSSTGHIGTPMPMDIIEKGIGLAVKALSPDGGLDAAKAIMTTDTVAKHCSVAIKVGGTTVTLGGMTKGAGMIAPMLTPARPKQATMLSYITSDANISRKALQNALEKAIGTSYNRIIVDGDMSTNDTLVAMANGTAGNTCIEEGTPEAELFAEAFASITGYLAREMVKDGEGVSKFVELNISGAANDRDARIIAEAIARSPLCKTAWFGGDPNWGRIVCAAGYCGVQLNPEDVDLDYNGVPIVRGGLDAGTPESGQEEAMKGPELRIDLKVGTGQGKFTIWTCDLTYDYVKINADYHT